MTALDVFRRYAAADKEIEQLEEQIERREALATGSTARPLSPDSGSRGSGDASMRLLDYVANKEELQAKLDARRQLKEADRACCIYLAETLLPQLAGIMIRVYIEGKGLKQTGAAKMREDIERRVTGNLVSMLTIRRGSKEVIVKLRKAD